MFKKVVILILCFNLAFLMGCATVQHIPLKKQDKYALKNIYINPHIKKPENMYEFVSGSEYGVLLGAVGGLIADAANKKAALSTQAAVERSHIDIREIVYQRLQKEFARKTNYRISDRPGNAILTAEIKWYGISIPHGFSSMYVPVLTVAAKLSIGNRVIWQDDETVGRHAADIPRYQMNDLLTDPQKFALMWDKAAKKIIDAMIVDLQK